MSTPARGREPRRRVDSGTWPLYVICLAMLLIASVVQAARWEVPPSVAKASPTWFDAVYIVAQPVGALVVLIALFGVRSLVPSLQLELIGCILNFVVGAGYIVAVIEQNDGPPATGATWLVAGFALYSMYRIHEINKAFGRDLLAPFRATVRWVRNRGGHS